jgi:hypothetical protein
MDDLKYKMDVLKYSKSLGLVKRWSDLPFLQNKKLEIILGLHAYYGLLTNYK